MAQQSYDNFLASFGQEPQAAPSSAVATNVGNLRKPDGSFYSFTTPEEGIQATLANIRKHAQQAPGQKLNLFGLIAGLRPDGSVPSDADANDPAMLKMRGGWAPKADKNDPVSYAQTLAHATGLDPYTDYIDPSDPDQMTKLISAMGQVEHGYRHAPGPDLVGRAVQAVLPARQQAQKEPQQSYEDFLNSFTPSQMTQQPTQQQSQASAPIPVVQGPEPFGPPSSQLSGNWRWPELLGSAGLQGLANLSDTGRSVGDAVGALTQKLGLDPTTQTVASKATGLLMPAGLTSLLPPEYSATGLLTKLGLINRPDLQPQTTGERLATEATSGLTGALPLAIASGGASVLPTLVSGVIGSVAAGEGKPVAEAVNRATGLPVGVGQAILGGLGGMVGGTGVSSLARMVGALPEGIASMVGAALPGRVLSNTVTPELRALFARAKAAGVDVPVQYLTQQAGELAPKVPPGMLTQTYQQLNRVLGKGLGLDQESFSPQDIQTARGNSGQRLDRIVNRYVQPLSTVQPQSWENLVNRLWQIKQDVNATGATAEAQTRLNPVFKQIEDVLSKSEDLTGTTYQQLTNKASPLYQTITSGSADTKYFGAQVRDALNDAAGDLMGPAGKAAYDAEKQIYKNTVLLDKPVRQGTSGTPDYQSAFNAIDQGYKGAQRAGDVGTAVTVGRLLPKLTPTGGEPIPAAIPGPLSSLLHSGAGAIGGVALVHELGPELLRLMSSSPSELTAAGVAAGTGALGIAGLQRASRALGNAQQSYLASPTGAQQLLRILRGKGPPSKAVLGTVGASQSQEAQ